MFDSTNFESVNCLICGSINTLRFEAASRHLNLLNPLGVVRCSSCGVLFLNPRPSAVARQQIFAGLKPAGLEDYLHYLANYGAITQSRKELFKLRIQQISKSYFPGKQARVLDIGASSGEFLEAVIAHGWEAVGVEPSVDGVRTANAKGLDVMQSPAEMLPFPDQSFDFVHSNHVFEHLAYPMEAAKEAYRVLKPGGVLFIEVPNQFDNIQFFRYRLTGAIPVRQRNIRSIHHLVFFSRNSLRGLLHRAGFENIMIKNRYGKGRRGLAYLGSLLVRLIGQFYLGAPIIQAIAVKQK